MTTGFKTQRNYLTVEAASASFYAALEAEQGKVATSYSWSDRQPHPINMSNYEDWANDPEANIAFNLLAGLIAGVGYYTEMPEQDAKGRDVNPEHKHKRIIDEYGEKVNLDEDLHQITLTMLQKGFCPVERLSNYDLKLLPPETFFIWRDKKGYIYRYTQERSQGNIISTWEDRNWKQNLEKLEEYYLKPEFKELMSFEAQDVSPLEDIILFINDQTTSRPYGKSLTEPIGNLLDDRAQMNKDMPKAIHRWAYPIPVVSTSRSKDTLQTAFIDRDVDEAVFIGNVNPDEFKMDTLAINPQARFIPYVELIYYQIAEGLHAPLLLYLKNATEASATVMMESVDRFVQGKQRYIKRRVEEYLFKPQVNDPVPRLIWGQPQTGLEDVTLSDVAALAPYLARNQLEDLLKQLGLELVEAEEKPQLPFQPFQKPAQPPQIPLEQMLNKVNDLQTSLSILEQAYQEGRVNLIKAMRDGGKAIEVYLSRAYGKDSATYIIKRDSEFQQWTRRLTSNKEGKPTYHVTVEP